MSEIKTSVAIGKVRLAVAAAGGGAGLAIGVAAIRAVTTRPEFLPQLLNGQFLFFSALVVGMVIASRKGDTFIAMNERNVIAQEKMAANVGALVTRDDSRERRLDLLLGELTRTSERNASSLLRIEDWIDGQRKTEG